MRRDLRYVPTHSIDVCDWGATADDTGVDDRGLKVDRNDKVIDRNEVLGALAGIEQQ